MIDVRRATKAAAEFASETLADDFAGATIEEVELSEDHREWRITLGIRRKKKISATLAQVRESVGEQPFDISDPEYKIFRVDAETGEVHSMKMRVVA